jgi:DNA/RNA-binding domain of Phe-tRNA-synthetase-like protein
MANKFMERKIEAEILVEIYEELETKLKNATKRYECVGKESEQARNWKTDELLWEDEEHTIPKYRDRYDYVEVPEDELTEEEKMKTRVIKNIMAKLEKM